MKKQVTVKVVLDRRYDKKNADTFPAKLRVTYQQEQRYFKTKYNFTKKVWDKMHGSRPDQLKDVLIELNGVEEKAKDIIDRMPVFSFELFKRKFLNYSDNNTLSNYFEAYAKELRENGQIGNAINNECASKSFEKFSPGKLLKEVDIYFLNSYQSWMENEGRSTTTISMYLRALRCIIKKAIETGDFSEAYPFGKNKFEIPEARNFKRALNESEIASIVNHECSGADAKARDFWYLIYLCGGINPQDLCSLKYSDIIRNRIEYLRSKTARTKKVKSKIQILLTNDIKNLIDKYGQRGDGYIFPILNNVKKPEEKKELIQLFIHWVNDHVKKIAKELKIDISVTTMVARHSYASQLLRSGISISAISKKMHDGNIKTTMNYLSDLTDEQEIEMAKALTSFKNKQQAKIVNL